MAIKYGREGGTLFVMQTIYQFERSHACKVNSFDAKTDTNSGLTNDARGLDLSSTVGYPQTGQELHLWYVRTAQRAPPAAIDAVHSCTLDSLPYLDIRRYAYWSRAAMNKVI